ncbi:MAG: hypothetical protein GKR98_15175 [Boseongicola sp.]|nr:MAG: hypothetical protein GKR98_15175 [Boseongicola sp.]
MSKNCTFKNCREVGRCLLGDVSPCPDFKLHDIIDMDLAEERARKRRLARSFVRLDSKHDLANVASQPRRATASA